MLWMDLIKSVRCNFQYELDIPNLMSFSNKKASSFNLVQMLILLLLNVASC